MVQLDLLGDFQVSESTLQTLDDARFGKMEKDGKILYRYVAFKGIDESAADDLGNFADFESVSAYARTAIAWASAGGIINGSADGRLMPKAGATRAQVAAILHRYIENCIF